jgi:hypothetical protein
MGSYFPSIASRSLNLIPATPPAGMAIVCGPDHVTGIPFPDQFCTVPPAKMGVSSQWGWMAATNFPW